jgi:hypothetical protein
MQPGLTWSPSLQRYTFVLAPTPLGGLMSLGLLTEELLDLGPMIHHRSSLLLTLLGFTALTDLARMQCVGGDRKHRKHRCCSCHLTRLAGRFWDHRAGPATNGVGTFAICHVARWAS